MPRLVDEVHVFAVPISESATADHAQLSILSPEERRRAEQYQLERPRLQFIATRAALRTVLGRMLDVPPSKVDLAANPRGKPCLGNVHEASNLCFNVAHSGETALIAIAAGCNVGVDVEAVREVSHLLQIARRHFHPAEFEALQSSVPGERAKAFLRCWTGKEAVVKALGTGLANSLSKFRVPVDSHGGSWIQIPEFGTVSSTRVWLQPLDPDNGYAAAVACVGQHRGAHCFLYNW